MYVFKVEIKQGFVEVLRKFAFCITMHSLTIFHAETVMGYIFSRSEKIKLFFNEK